MSDDSASESIDYNSCDIKFVDEDTSSSDDIEYLESQVTSTPLPEHIFKDIYCIKELYLSVTNFNYKSWKKVFKNKKVDIISLLKTNDWDDFFSTIIDSKQYEELCEFLTMEIKNGKTIFPPPELVFTTLNILNPNDIKIVLIGQDPYLKEKQAMGLSFSLPHNTQLTPSLRNIYTNLVKYGHLQSINNSTLLVPWVLQGILLINATLTLEKGKSNSHEKYWDKIMEAFMKYLNDKCENLVFIVWGKSAHMLCLNTIDINRHYIITSSHPSPHSFTRTFSGFTYGHKKKKYEYPAFCDVDHFGQANKFLVNNKKDPVTLQTGPLFI
jgi:uracil-DNA glycosylase